MKKKNAVVEKAREEVMRRRRQLQSRQSKNNAQAVSVPQPRSKKQTSGVVRGFKAAARAALNVGGGLLGEGVGDAIGIPGGGAIGSKIGGYFSRLLGFGAYQVQNNSLVQSHPVPTFSASRDGEDGIIVTHSEFLTNIDGSTGYNNRLFPINPGMQASFPWLSIVSTGFTEYQLLGMVFEYKPLSGNIAGASPALGAVILATNYNVSEPAFPNKIAACSTQYTVSGVPCSELLHPVECKPMTNLVNRYLIRHTDPPNDVALYDVGNFQVITEGMQSVYQIGELWVTYHVRLTRPSLGLALAMTDWYNSDGPAEETDTFSIYMRLRQSSTLHSHFEESELVTPGTPANVFTMPPITGDIMFAAEVHITLTGPIGGNSAISNVGAAFSSIEWFGPSTENVAATDTQTAMHTYVFHIDSSIYNSDSTVDRAARSFIYTPATWTGKARYTVCVSTLPTGVGDSELTLGRTQANSMDINRMIAAYFKKQGVTPMKEVPYVAEINVKKR